MEISEVRVKLINNPSDRLKAFCSITLDGDFVIRDLKIIEGSTGMFVAMPSRKLSDRCPKCRAKNHLRASYCNECGEGLQKDRVSRDSLGRTKLHADIAHPINTAYRERLQECVVEAYEEECELAKQPGYEPVSDEEIAYEPDDHENVIAELKRDAAVRKERQTQDFSDNIDAGTSESNEDVSDSWVDDAADLRRDDGDTEAEAEEPVPLVSQAASGEEGTQRGDDTGWGGAELPASEPASPPSGMDESRQDPDAGGGGADSPGQRIDSDSDDFGAGIL